MTDSAFDPTTPSAAPGITGAPRTPTGTVNPGTMSDASATSSRTITAADAHTHHAHDGHAHHDHDGKSKIADIATRESPVGPKTAGGVSGVAAGAAIGAAAGGPVGAVVGAAVGAVAGIGVAKGVDAMINPEEEDAHWREHHASAPYATADRGYDHYRPAYQYGWEARRTYGAKPYDDIEPELERNWDSWRGGNSQLSWSEARPATRAAWDRIERRTFERGQGTGADFGRNETVL